MLQEFPLRTPSGLWVEGGWDRDPGPVSGLRRTPSGRSTYSAPIVDDYEGLWNPHRVTEPGSKSLSEIRRGEVWGVGEYRFCEFVPGRCETSPTRLRY